jgi:hypothetical protein
VSILRRSALEKFFLDMLTVDISYAAPQTHGIVNVALYRVCSLGIVFIFPQGGRISIMSKTNTGCNSNEYY